MKSLALHPENPRYFLFRGKPAVLIVELPGEENEHFQLRKYGLYALKHTYNRGIIFRDFPVPAANLLRVHKGNGLTIAYHGLNLGELYDMEADPHEFTSLWDSPEHQAVKTELLLKSYDATIKTMPYGPPLVMPY